MATVEREYDFDRSTYDFGGGDPSLDGFDGEEDGGGSGCIGHLLWAAVIYGVAIGLAIVTPGAGDLWGMVVAAAGEGVNWVQESANVRLLAFSLMLLLLSPAGWWGALISFLVGTVLTMIGWWVLPVDVWGLGFPNWYVDNSVGMYWFLWIATLTRSLVRF